MAPRVGYKKVICFFTRMIDIHPIDRVRKWFSLNRLTVLNEHYLAVKDELAPKSKAGAAEAAYLSTQFEKYHKKASLLANYRVLFYLILYATIFTSFLKVIPYLSILVTFIELSNALIGTSVAFIIIFLLSVKINMHYQRMQVCMTHLVSLYTQNNRRDATKALRRISRVV